MISFIKHSRTYKGLIAGVACGSKIGKGLWRGGKAGFRRA
jgi:hypothetical protein